MRIYLPLSDADRSALRAGHVDLELADGRAVWAAWDGARAENPSADVEDLEYEAIQDAVHVAFADDVHGRAAVLAGDVPATSLSEDTDTLGAFGLRVLDAARVVPVSIHVTELVGTAAAADDTDPALLWFDVTEAREALDYCESRER